MKKIFIAVFCLILVLSVFLAPLLLKSTESSPQGITNTFNQSDLQQSPTITQPTPTSTTSATPQSTDQSSQSTPQSSIQPNSQPTLQLTAENLQNAVGNATNFLKGTNESYALLLMNVVYRRFGVTAFADSLERYDQILASNQQNAQLLRVFRRIADYNNQLQTGDMNSVTAETDKVTVPALYSDRQNISSNYPDLIYEAANSGGYSLTHALLASIWFRENGHELSADFTSSLYVKSAALIRVDQTVTDLEVEAASLLYLAGQGSKVDPVFIQYVLDAQRSDGGWSNTNATSDESNWHTTVLALLLLLHVAYPTGSYPPMLDSS